MNQPPFSCAKTSPSSILEETLCHPESSQVQGLRVRELGHCGSCNPLPLPPFGLSQDRKPAWQKRPFLHADGWQSCYSASLFPLLPLLKASLVQPGAISSTGNLLISIPRMQQPGQPEGPLQIYLEGVICPARGVGRGAMGTRGHTVV